MPTAFSLRRVIRVAIGASATAAIVLACLTATQAPAKATQMSSLSFLVKQDSAATPDPAFPHPGDTIVVMQRNLMNGEVVGHDATACIVTNSAGLIQCTTTVNLPGGFFEVAFPEVLGAKDITAPITASTGRYAGTTGYFALHQLGDDEFRATLHAR